MTPHQFAADPTNLPEEVTAVFTNFLTCELTTIGKSGYPITWPVMPFYWQEGAKFILLTSIGLPQKAFNVLRNPHVSLLFSDPTGSDLADPPTILVQGHAETSKQIIAGFDGIKPELRGLVLAQTKKMVERQPAMKLYTNNPISRYLMDWYFMRLMITVTPRSIQWWDKDGSATSELIHQPEEKEISYVG